jgi:DNA-binding LytR/AlgR family response regulator
LRPDAVFVDINLPGKDGVSLATQLAMLPQPPRLVFTTGNANRATDAFRLEAVDYLLKPLDPEQVTEAVNRLLAYLRPFEAGSLPSSSDLGNGVPTADKMRFTDGLNSNKGTKCDIEICYSAALFREFKCAASESWTPPASLPLGLPAGQSPCILI